MEMEICPSFQLEIVMKNLAYGAGSLDKLFLNCASEKHKCK